MPDPNGMDQLLAVLAESEADGLRGPICSKPSAVVWFDYRNRELNEQMSLAADVKIIWGGAEARFGPSPACRAANIAWKSSSARNTRSA